MRKSLIICTLFLIFPSCSYHISESDIFSPTKVSRLNGDIHLEEVYLTTKDSIQLHGWFIKHDNARGTFLYFGGNGFYLWNRLTPDVINTLTSFNMNLMLIDYRGFGRSEGTPSIKGIFEDGECSYNYLCSRNDIDTSKIIVYGHSLGTFVATHLADSHHFSGIVLEAAISNTSEMKDAALKENAPWYLRWLVSVDADSAVLSLDNMEMVKELQQPLLVLTGENDKITPPEMGKKVYDSAGSEIKKFAIIPKGDHKDLYFNRIDGRKAEFDKVLSEYLSKVFE